MKLVRMPWRSVMLVMLMAFPLLWLSLADRVAGPEKPEADAEHRSGLPRVVDEQPDMEEPGLDPPGGEAWIEGIVIAEEESHPVSARVRGLIHRRTGWQTTDWVDAGEGGRFLLEGLVPGTTVSLEASAGQGERRNYADHDSVKLERGRNRIVLELVRGATIRGQVTERGTGAPVSGATIRLGSAGVVLAVSIPAGIDGRFIVRGAFGLVNMFAEAPGYGESELWMEKIRSGSNREIEIVLELPEERMVAGSVVNPRGGSISGTTVLVRFGSRSRAAVSGPDGRFRVLKVPRDLELEIDIYISPGSKHRDPGVFGPSFGEMEYRPVTLVIGAEVSASNLRVVLPRSASVRGRVLNGSGAPLAGSPVQIVSTGGEDNGRLWSGHADDHGCFRFVNLAPGKYECSCVEARELPGEVLDRYEGRDFCHSFELSEGEALSGIELAAHHIAIIEGRVLQADGSPLALSRRRMVRVEGRSELFLDRRPWTRLKRDGRFRLPVLRDGFPYLVSVREAASNLTRDTIVDNPDDGEIILREFHLKYGSLAVHVADDRGREIRDFEVFLNGRTEGVDRDYGRRFENPRDGARWDRLVPGHYVLRVLVPNSKIITYGFVEIRAGSTEEAEVVVPTE